MVPHMIRFLAITLSRTRLWLHCYTIVKVYGIVIAREIYLLFDFK